MYTIAYSLIFIASFSCMIYMELQDYKKIDRIHWALIIIMQFVLWGYFALSMARTTQEGLIANDVLQLDGTFLPILFLMSLLSSLKISIPKWERLALYLAAVAHLMLIWFGSKNGLYYAKVQVKIDTQGSYLVSESGPLKWIHYTYIAAVFGIMIAILVKNSARQKIENDLTAKCFYIVIISIIIAYVIQIIMNPKFEFLPIIYMISEWIIAYAYDKSLLYDIEGIVSSMQDKSDSVHAYVAFDLHKRYLGCTQKAIELIPEIAAFRINTRPISDDKNADIIAMFERGMDELETGKIKQEHLKRDDRVLLNSISYFSLRANGKIMGFMFEITDDTERQKYIEDMERMNEELKEKTEQAKVANEAKSRFLANMSHEIRTPISVVLGLDTMILRESKEDNILEYATDIEGAGRTLLALINDILDLSKIESGKMEIIPSEYELASVIHDVMIMTATKANAKNLLLHLEMDENLPAGLYGDDVRIRQILVNIMNNAVKYTEKGSINLKVNGEVEGDEVILHFAVKDTGIGIKQEDMGKLFADFERIEESRNRGIEGTGLGMSITAQFLALMGSKLEVSSVYGEGTEFSFDLRQKICSYEPVGNLEERIKKRADKSTYNAMFIAPGAKILLVDDNAINRKVFRNLLKQTKMQIDEAGGGYEALSQMEKNTYDIIFLDHMMPDLDGVNVLHKAKEDPKRYGNTETPIVVLTANAISGAKEEYLAEGFADYLSKPIDFQKLEKMIVRLLPEKLQQQGKVDAEESEKIVEQSEPSQGMDMLPKIDGIDWNYAMLKLNHVDMILDVINDFVILAPKEMERLLSYYNQMKESEASDSGEQMLDQFRILVHSMKSTTAMLGATDVSALAKILEYAAKDGNVTLIDAVLESFVAEWNGLWEQLKNSELGRNNHLAKSQEMLEDEKVREAFDKLMDAMEDYELEIADEIMEMLTSYSYEDSKQKIIDELAIAVRQLDKVAIAELISRWSERL